jgi:uncharacterized protein (TIRG00374 family)
MKRYLPFVVSIGLLILLAVFAPWQQALDELGDLKITTFGLLLMFSLIYYAAKTYRYWLMLGPIGIKQPFKVVALTYLSAQSVTLLPAGELYRNTMLERYTGVGMAKSSPTFLMQGVLEGVVLAGLALLGAATLKKAALPIGVVAFLIAGIIFVLKGGYLARSRRLAGWINKLPFIQVSRRRLQTFSKQNEALLSSKIFAGLIGLSLISELAGVAIIYTSIHALGGHINFYAASIIYTVPIVVSFVTFLPGGLGANEQSSVGLMLLFHVSAVVAVAAVLLTRIYITGLGVIYGWIAGSILRFSRNYEEV